MPSLRSTGAVSIVTSEGYEIVRIVDDTPAALAGLRVGDIIVAVDGRPIAELGCDRWNTVARDRTRLTISREDSNFDVRLEVLDIVR